MAEFQNSRGPRIYNGQSDQDKLLLLEKKKNRQIKEVHRVRRNRILAVFAVLIGILVFQIISVNYHTSQIKNDVNASRVQYDKAAAENKELQQKVKKLNDEDYIGKLIRYKYYYSKPGEVIYNLPEHEFEFKVKND